MIARFIAAVTNQIIDNLLLPPVAFGVDPDVDPKYNPEMSPRN
jgi:hypothetical protein